MPLSNLMLTILDQAIEPLRCLHGAGYFTEEEWVQLDLIMNKKYIWTTGPDHPTKVSKSNLYGPKSGIIALHDAISSDLQSKGEKINANAEVISICTSAEPSTEEVLTPAVSLDTPWELSPAMASPLPFQPRPKELSEYSRLQSGSGIVSGFNKTRPTEAPVLNLGFTNNASRESRSERNIEGAYTISKPRTTPRHISVSSWASEVLNSPMHKADLRPASQTSGLSSELIDHMNVDPSLEPSDSTANSYNGDVNAFETNNAAEWDELPSIQPKNQPKKDISVLLEEKFDKDDLDFTPSLTPQQIANILIQGHRENPQIQVKTTPLPPRTEIRNIQRTATTSRSTRRKEVKDIKEAKERPTNPPPKTRTCWFWAESVGGCRYRPEECLNLHVRPEPGTLPNYPLKDGKPTWGSLADSLPEDVPTGKKPRSCWFWATRGLCDKGNACEYVHGWVAGGVASRPVFVDNVNLPRYKASDEEVKTERYMIDDDEFALNETDVGDKAPSLMVDMDPGAIASRIHAPEWFPLPA